MNRVYKILLVASVALFAIACGDEAPVGDEWGRTEYYESSIFKKYEPVIMEQVLEFKLDEDGQKMFANGQGIVELYVTSKPGENIPNKNVVVHLNGEKQLDDNDQPDNKISIHIDNVEKPIFCTLGLEFLGSAADGEHHLYLYTSDTPAKNYVKTVEVDGIWEDVRDNSLNMDLGALADKDGGFYIIKKTVKNPGDVMFYSILTALLVLFVLSVVISRMITQRIKVTYLELTGAYHKRVRVKGYYSVEFTSSKKKQNFWCKLYKGIILYEVHPSWGAGVTIYPRKSESVSIRYDATRYLCDSRVLQKQNNYTLEDLETRQKTNIRVM